MAILWNRAGHYIVILWILLSFFPFFLSFLSFFPSFFHSFFLFYLFLSFFFLALCQPPEIGCLPYFHTWCGLSANLGCRSETCCTLLAENTVCKEIAKNSPSAHHRTTLSGYIFATKARIDNRKKKLLSSNISSRCPTIW